ncbi:MAG: hypothetical protein ABR518_02050 [Actinomycetota bacterium]
MPDRTSFKLEVLGRYQARTPGNENAVTANLVAGNQVGHLVFAGTVTMTESQFESFTEALKTGLGDRFEVDEWQDPSGDE